MGKYLVSVSYSAEGARGVMKEGGVARRTNLEGLVSGLGGTVEAFYYAFGEDDVYVIVDLPDDVVAAALAMAVGASGAGSIKTTVLLTPEQLDEAAKKSIGYRAPGA